MQQNSKKVSKLVVGLFLVLAGAGLLAWALMGREVEAPAENTTESQTSQAETDDTVNENEAASETSVITFTNNGFTPSETTVKKGATVTIKNDSNVDMQFSSDDHPTHRKQTEMNLEVLQPGESASFAVSRVGTWGFHDHMDSSKTGTLTVTE